MSGGTDLWEAADIPEWPLLLDVPGFLAQSFGHEPALTIPLLLRALKAGDVIHKVVGLETISSPGRSSLPNGFARSSHRVGNEHLTQVVQWDAVGFKPATGTVSGRSEGDRHVLALWWPTVERWERGARDAITRQMAADHEVAPPQRRSAIDSATPSGKPLEPAPIEHLQVRTAPLIPRKSGLDYRSSDQDLADRMHALIVNRQATGINDAARALAEKAQGRGTADSKRKRLLHVYKARYPDR